MSPCSPRSSASDGNKNPHWGAARGKEWRSRKSGRRRSEKEKGGSGEATRKMGKREKQRK